MLSFYLVFVCGFLIVVGFIDGFSLINFVILLIFILIVMYDAVGVRREVGK